MVNRTCLIGLATALVLLLLVAGCGGSALEDNISELEKEVSVLNQFKANLNFRIGLLEDRVVQLEKEAIWLHSCATTTVHPDVGESWSANREHCDLDWIIQMKVYGDGDYEPSSPFRWDGEVTTNYYHPNWTR